MTRLSSLFSEKIGIDADFYLTEENFQSQRFLFAGMEQLRELAEMKKAGIFDFETVLLIDEAPAYSEKLVMYPEKPVIYSEKSVTYSEKPPAAVSSIKNENLQAATGFVLVERQPSGNPDCRDTGDCLVFTSAVSDAATKHEFLSILREITAQPFTGDASVCLQISEKELVSDVTEYYAKTALSFFRESGELLPSYDSVYSESRVQKAVRTLQKISGLPAVKESGRALLPPSSESGFGVLEICCGNGMSTLGIYEEGTIPLSVDINAEDICIGLAHGVLKPEKTIIMDATTLSKNLDTEKFDTVIGFMIGTIYEFNKDLWFSIIGEALKMLKPEGFFLLTLRAEHEAMWISDYLKPKGIAGEIIDNRDDETNYDEWIYFARK